MAELSTRKIIMSEAVFDELIKLKDELESIIETIEILNDKELTAGLERSKKDVENGRVYKLKNVDELEEIWK
jgi:hypothetical protein